MGTNSSGRIAQILRDKKLHRRLLAVLGTLSAAVFLVTIYVLTAPIQTKEAEEQVLGCGFHLHAHSEACYNEERELTCGRADFVVHEHDSHCIAGGELVCDLEVIAAHEHTDDCYSEELVVACGLEEGGHRHDKTCYSPMLTCGEEHEHSDACYTDSLVCPLKESGHHHDDSCLKRETVLTCENPAVLHKHHKHNDACYNRAKALICTEESCYDEDDQLICGQIEVLEHIHGAACYHSANETTAPETEPTEATQPATEATQASEPAALPELSDSNVAMAASFRSGEPTPVAETNENAVAGTGWDFNIHYVGQNTVPGDENRVHKTADFQLKYQMQFNVSSNIAAGDVEIRIPAVLLTDRYGNAIAPSDIGVPQGSLEKYTASRMSPFNYYYETDEDGILWLVFFNYKNIPSGYNSSWQVYYDYMPSVKIVDGTQWELPATITVKNVALSDGSTENQTRTCLPLTGDVDTGVILSSVTKGAYYLPGITSYTPTLYTAYHAGGFTDNRMVDVKKLDFDNYVYSVWTVDTVFGYGQAWKLLMKDIPYVDGPNGTRYEGEVVSVRSIENPLQYPVVTASGNEEYPLLLEQYTADNIPEEKAVSNNNVHRSYYVVTRIEKKYMQPGTMMKNEVTLLLDPADQVDPDQIKTANASYTFKEYEWTYKGDIIGVDKYTDFIYRTKTINSWTSIYSYISDIGKGKDQGEDYTGGINFQYASILNAYYYTNSLEYIDGKMRFVPGKTDYIPNTKATHISSDDFVFAWVNAEGSDGKEEVSKLSKEDYYFSKIRITGRDRSMNYYEDRLVEPTTDAHIAELGGDPIDRTMYVYAMFALDADGNEIPGDGTTDAEWEPVGSVPWNETGEQVYTFTDEQIAREPYRFRIVHDTIDSSHFSSDVRIAIKHDSPVFNRWMQEYPDSAVTLENIAGVHGKVIDRYGNQSWIGQDPNDPNYQEQAVVDLKGFTRALYQMEDGTGMLIMRDSAQNTLTPLSTEAASAKYSTLKNDPVNAQYNISYSLRAYESYQLGSPSDAAALEENGVTTLINRKNVEFYDLLPPDVQFDASVPVTAFRQTCYSIEQEDWNKLGYNSKDMSITVKEIIEDWRGTGRMMVVFSVRYGGKDPSVYSLNHWLTGYRINFGAYVTWENAGESLEIPNIAAYMPVADDRNPLVGKATEVAYDNGVIVPTSLAEICRPITAGGGDLNGDGEKNIRNVLYMEDANSKDFAVATNDSITKLVKADADLIGAYDISAAVENGKTYTYRLTLANPNATPLSDLVIFDKLENAAVDRQGLEPEIGFPTDTSLPWHGTFVSVDLRAARALGCEPVVYYNTSLANVTLVNCQATYADLDENHGWYTEARWKELGKTEADVKAVAVDFSKRSDGSDFQLIGTPEQAAVLEFYIKMRAPETIPSYVWAFNNPAYSSVKDKGKPSATPGTVVGNSVKVTLWGRSSFEIVKYTQGAPVDRRNDDFTFVVTDEDDEPYTYQFYNLYDLVGDEWVLQENTTLSTDFEGKLTLKANQKAVFFGQAGADKLKAEEINPSVYWKHTCVDTIKEDEHRKISEFTNTWNPLLYLFKYIDGLSAYDKPANYLDDVFCFQIQTKNDNGEWVDAAGLEYGKVSRVNTTSYSAPTFTRLGCTDSQGVLPFRYGQNIAVQPGQIGTEFRVREVAYENGILREPDAQGLETEGWISLVPEYTGSLAAYGNNVSIVNYRKIKYVYLTKEITSQKLSDCNETFHFELLDAQDNPIAGAQIVTYADAEKLAAGVPLLESVTDANGRFTIRPGTVVRIAVAAGEDFQLNEVNGNPDYQLQEVLTDTQNGSATCSDVGFRYCYNIKGRDFFATFTNDYRRRDLAVTKQVLSKTEVVEKSFRMRLEKLNAATGTWECTAGQPFEIRSNIGVVLSTGTTDATGSFLLPAGKTAYFTEIGVVGEQFRVIETWDSNYPQLVPITEASGTITEGEPLVLPLGEDGAAGTIVNGSPGMVLINKQWRGQDEAAGQWIADNTDKLGIYLNVEIRRNGEADFRPVNTNDQCSYMFITVQDGESIQQIYPMTSGIIHYEDPANTSLVLLSDAADWMTTAYRITETDIDQANVKTPLDGTILSENGSVTYRLRGENTVCTGMPTTDTIATLSNTVASAGTSWIYKYLQRDGVSPAPGAELVLRVERYTGSAWVPAAGMDYVVSYRNNKRLDPETNEFLLPEVLDGHVFQTGHDGLIRVTNDGAEALTPYQLAVGFFTQVHIGMNSGMKAGDYRVVEVADQTDPTWGKLIAYTDAAGGTTTEGPVGFLNAHASKKLRVEKRMSDNAVGLGPFYFRLKQTIGEENVVAAGLPYKLYDRASGQEIGSGFTNADGVFELLSGQYAEVEILTMGSWNIEELVKYPFEVEQITVNTGTDNEGTVNEDGTGVDIGMPFAVLKTGPEIAKLMKNSTIKNVVFGYAAEYANAVAGVEGVNADVENEGKIKLYRVLDGSGGYTVYILSDYPIRANANCSQMFQSMKALLTVKCDNFDTVNTESMESMFDGCENLTDPDVGGWKTGNVTNMKKVFASCRQLQSVDVELWNTSSVTDMTSMFNYCDNMKELDLGAWDVSKVKYFDDMFYNCMKLEKLIVENWVTDSALSMKQMFRCYNSTLKELKLNVDGVHWNTGNVTNMAGMFELLQGVTELNVSRFDTHNVTNMQNMFRYCDKLKTLTVTRDGDIWDTSKVTNMSGMFELLQALTELDVTTLDTHNVTNMNNMFRYSNNLKALNVTRNGNIWDTSKVTNMSGMFELLSALTELDVSTLDTHNVTNMNNMFRADSNLKAINVTRNGDIWDTSKVTNMGGMFELCSAVRTLDLSTLDTHNVTTIASMFRCCYALEELIIPTNGDIWNTSKVTDMSKLFELDSKLRVLDLSGWNTAKVAITNALFANCSELQTVNLSGWSFAGSSSDVVDGLFYNRSSSKKNTPNLTTLIMDDCDVSNQTTLLQMCFYLKELTTVSMKNWDITKVSSTASMFSGCTNLRSIDLSGWHRDATAGTIMLYNLFGDCASLQDLKIPNDMNFSKADMRSIFSGCSSLTSLDIANWNTAGATDMDSMFMGCAALTSLDINNWDTSSVTSMKSMFAETGLTGLDLSKWDTSSVISMDGMFKYSRALRYVDLRNAETKSGAYLANMFQMKQNESTMLEWVRLDKFDPSASVMYMFKDCSSLQRVYAKDWNHASVASSGLVFAGCTSIVGQTGTTLGSDVSGAMCKQSGGYFTDPSSAP